MLTAWVDVEARAGIRAHKTTRVRSCIVRWYPPRVGPNPTALFSVQNLAGDFLFVGSGVGSQEHALRMARLACEEEI